MVLSALLTIKLMLEGLNPYTQWINSISYTLKQEQTTESCRINEVSLLHKQKIEIKQMKKGKKKSGGNRQYKKEMI